MTGFVHSSIQGRQVSRVWYWAALGGHGSKVRCESVRDEQEGEETTSVGPHAEPDSEQEHMREVSGVAFWHVTFDHR